MEINEMKEQFNLLKKKLDSQTVINQKMIRQAMKSKLGGINRTGRAMFILGVFVAIWAPGFFLHLGTSYTFCGATFIMLLFCAFKTWKYHRKLWSMKITDSDMVEIARNVSILHQEYQNWIKIALPMVLVWVIWLGVEAYMILNEDGIYLYFMGGALVGGLIGGFIGTRINNKVKREAEELLEQIKEYSELKK